MTTFTEEVDDILMDVLRCTKDQDDRYFINDWTEDITDELNKARLSFLNLVSERIIGKDLKPFGPQNEAGDISEDDYMIAGYNLRGEQQRTTLYEGTKEQNNVSTK